MSKCERERESERAREREKETKRKRERERERERETSKARREPARNSSLSKVPSLSFCSAYIFARTKKPAIGFKNILPDTGVRVKKLSGNCSCVGGVEG